MTTPHISIVAVGRNDNYGGDFRDRLQAFVSWTCTKLNDFEVSSEIIFVNYNPVDTAPIEEFIDWPSSSKLVEVKIITVPPAVHAEVVNDKSVKDVPVLEYVAKNVGIRRAKGSYILCMNPDILMSDGLFKQFSQLSSDCYYRANRLDFEGKVDLSVKESLYRQLKEKVNAVWFKGIRYSFISFSYCKYALFGIHASLYNRWRRFTVHLRPFLDFLSIPVYYDNIEYRFHCNASGDFMLMHRDAWMGLKGYKESSYISLHVDSLMVLQAAFSGLSEKIFWQPIYHRDHERRFDAVGKDNSDQQEVYKRFREDIGQIVSSGKPKIYNDAGWGLSSEILPERIV